MTEQPDIELGRWRRQWQNLGGRADLAQALSERVRHDRRRLQRELALELASAAASTALCVWLMVRSQGRAVVVVACAAALLFTGVWVMRLWTLKHRGLQVAASGLDAFIELTRERLVGELEWQTFRRRSLNVLLPLLVPWTIWAVYQRYPVYRAEPWLAAFELGLLLALVIGLKIHLPRKVRDAEGMCQRFEAMVDEQTLR